VLLDNFGLPTMIMHNYYSTTTDRIFNSLSYVAYETRMWANAQRDGRPAEHKWCPLFNAAKFG